MIKNPPIPIKAIYNDVGSVTLDPDFFLQVRTNMDALENIEPEIIDEAKKMVQILK